jgi:hypothetical protein
VNGLKLMVSGYVGPFHSHKILLPAKSNRE